MSTRTNKLRSDVAESVGKLFNNPGIRSCVIRDIVENVPGISTKAGANNTALNGANTALNFAEPIIEELERELATKSRELEQVSNALENSRANNLLLESDNARMANAIKQVTKTVGPLAADVYAKAASCGHVTFSEWYRERVDEAVEIIRYRESEFVAAHKRLAELEREVADIRLAYEHVCWTGAAKDKRIEELEALKAQLESGNFAVAAKVANIKADVSRLKADDKEKRLYGLLKRYDNGGECGEVLLRSNGYWEVLRYDMADREMKLVCQGDGGLSAIAALEELAKPKEKPREPTPEEVIEDGWNTLNDIKIALAQDDRFGDSAPLDKALLLTESLLAEKREREAVVGVDPGAAEGSQSVTTVVQEPEWPQAFECGEKCVVWTSRRECKTYSRDGQDLNDSYWDYDTISRSALDNEAHGTGGWRRIPEPEWAKAGGEVT
jgi:hypothetical protein